MDLTVGIIEEKLRKFPKEKTVHLSCECCHHSAGGSETILGIIENSDYIELNFNDSSQSNVELSKDKEDWYKFILRDFERALEKQNEELQNYREYFNSIKRASDYLNNK